MVSRGPATRSVAQNMSRGGGGEEVECHVSFDACCLALVYEHAKVGYA